MFWCYPLLLTSFKENSIQPLFFCILFPLDLQACFCRPCTFPSPASVENAPLDQQLYSFISYESEEIGNVPLFLTITPAYTAQYLVYSKYLVIIWGRLTLRNISNINLFSSYSYQQGLDHSKKADQ